MGPGRGKDTPPSRSVHAEGGDEPRVLMLGKEWFPTALGGLDRYYRSLLEHLPEAGGVVVGPAADAPPTVAAVSDALAALPRRLFAFWLAAERAATGYDVVDAHFALYAAAPLTIGRLRKTPAIFHFHGPWAEESVSTGRVSRSAYRLRYALERRTLRRAAAFVVLSGAFRRVLVERYGVAPWDVHVWAPAVSLDVFSPVSRADARARLGLDPLAFVVACTRRMVPRMGIAGLLDAWERLDGEIPDGATLLLAGDGPLRDSLERRAASPRLAGRVRFMGTLRDDQLRDVYSAADVSAVPSSALEGFGLVVLESAACGTPSIVSDVGGLPEAVSGLDRGLVVAAGDAGAWSDRLASAARGELPTRADTRRFAERFDWQPLAERHRTLHRRLVAGEHDQRLRVVYLDHVARLSGAEIALLRLLEHLSEVNAHVILGEDGPLARRLSEAGISVEVLPVAAAVRDLRRDAVHPGTISPSVLAGAAAYTVRLARRLHRLRPDLVHTNSLKAGVYGSVAARAARLPVVWHVHDRIASDYLPASSATVVRWMVRHLAGGVIANSNATMASLGTERGGPVRSVVPSIIPSPRPLPGPRRSGAGPTTFGMVGRIAPWKGQDLFLRAFAQAFPGGGERAVLVGSAMFGEDAYEAELIKLVDHLDLGARVEFRGFRDDVFGELASFDVLVHASLIPEPFGQSVLEAMASGLAVIAADAGGPAEIIVDGVNGRLFASTDPISLAQAMRELAGQQSERARLGAAAVAAAERCNPASVTAQVMDLYASVLAVVH